MYTSIVLLDQNSSQNNVAVLQMASITGTYIVSILWKLDWFHITFNRLCSLLEECDN